MTLEQDTSAPSIHFCAMGITKAPPSRAAARMQGEKACTGSAWHHRWLLLSECQFSPWKKKGFLEEMGLVWGVEGWVIIVIILLFLLTPGAMLLLECIVCFNPQQPYEAFIFFFNFGWKLMLSQRRQFTPSHTVKCRKKNFNSSANTGVGVRGRTE